MNTQFDTKMIDIALATAEKIGNVLDNSRSRFFERDDASLAMATALASGTHMIMFGAPGTTKTALGNYFAQSLGVRYYYQQLNGSTQEESLFGPISMKGLNNDEWNRKWAGLALAHIGFCDEAGKASNLVQNQLLNVMQERQISIADTVHKLPLHTLISGSNETIDDNPAFYDRFTIRVKVNQIQNMDNFASMLVSDLDPCQEHIDPDNLPALRCVASHMAKNASQEVIGKIIQLRSTIANESGHYVSDRRWKSILAVAAGHALLQGYAVIRVTDLHTAKWLLWEDPDHITKLYDFVTKITDEDLLRFREMSLLVNELVTQVEQLTPDSSSNQQGELLHRSNTLRGKLKKFSGKEWKQLQTTVSDCIDRIEGLYDEEFQNDTF